MMSNDPHRSWLQELRRLSVRLSGGLPDEQPGTVPHLKEEITSLRERIINTDPVSKDGVLAQIDLLSDLAWNDTIRRLVCRLGSHIRRLWPE